MGTIQETENEIVEEFALFDSDEDKYEYIIELGKKLPLLADEYKTDDNKIKGCQSTVWMHADYENGKVYFNADSNSTITKGLISLLIRVLSGHTPDEILQTSLDFIVKIGMGRFIGIQRSNGFASMIKQMKEKALAYKLKNEMHGN